VLLDRYMFPAEISEVDGRFAGYRASPFSLGFKPG